MEATYRAKHVVDRADIDELGHASNVAYIRWVQQVARAHSEYLGYGLPEYVEIGVVFVVRRHEIDYLRPAFEGDELTLETWMEGFSAATSVRQTRILGGDGKELLARATTTWALVSTTTGRPCRIPKNLRDTFLAGDPPSAAETPARSAKPSKPRRRDSAKGEAKPFLKWAGGKRSLIGALLQHLPTSFKRYHEPFVGGGALFFHLRRKRSTLADNNERLIHTYQGLRDDPDRVISLLASYPHEREFFLSLRKRDTDAMDDAEVAAWFIYLNKTGYNGLYRVNSKNGFNVPFGDYKRPNICNEPVLRACAELLQKIRLEVGDFETTTQRARKGDLVYFDPPYVPLSASSSFTSYTKHGFDMDAQVRLRDVALALKRRGVHVLLSNSSAKPVYELYGEQFELIEVHARRSINSRTDKRGEIKELLIK